MNNTDYIKNTDCYVQGTCKKYKSNLCVEPFCIRLYKINELYNKSLLSYEQRQPIQLRLDVDRVDEQPYILLQSYQKDILNFVNDGSNLYIYSSNTGNGKTSWALKLIQSYIHKIWASSDLKCRALFISVPKFTRELKLNIDRKSNYIKYVNENIENADMVIWDDIATKTTSEFEHEQLISIIDSRIDTNKCNIFTSNVSPNELEKYVGARLTSRIVGLSTLVQFKGLDKRGVKQ